MLPPKYQSNDTDNCPGLSPICPVRFTNLPGVNRPFLLVEMGRGGGFFHSKGTWGCAAREGILFRPSSLAKGVLFGNFNRVKSRQGYAFWEFWSKRC